jgi:hypothetical protein
MATFMLLIKGGSQDWASYTPEQAQAALQRYVDWASALRASGQLLHADELHEAAVVMRRKDGQIVTDGPFVESKEAIGGYYMYRAADMAEAAEIGKACPALDHGGAVEIHEVVER